MKRHFDLRIFYILRSETPSPSGRCGPARAWRSDIGRFIPWSSGTQTLADLFGMLSHRPNVQLQSGWLSTVRLWLPCQILVYGQFFRQINYDFSKKTCIQGNFIHSPSYLNSYWVLKWSMRIFWSFCRQLFRLLLILFSCTVSFAENVKTELT